MNEADMGAINLLIWEKIKEKVFINFNKTKWENNTKIKNPIFDYSILCFF